MTLKQARAEVRIDHTNAWRSGHSHAWYEYPYLDAERLERVETEKSERGPHDPLLRGRVLTLLFL